MAFYSRNNTVYPPSTRNAQGRGSMKKGHRRNGDMWINVKRSWGGFSRGADFNENLTIGEFVDRVVRDVSTEEGFQDFQEGWYVEVQSFRKALDADEHTEMLKERFDGGETVHAKVSELEFKVVSFVYSPS
ncbi:hypothetical protein R3P38DRAFT_3302404 [Favolaschia claudopus]|uniref:Uncharacterized protein n=1 Tax=Favolaschia claudopus TaxID=2862362 RepID=A0AAW0EIA3_9AGAR